MKELICKQCGKAFTLNFKDHMIMEESLPHEMARDLHDIDNGKIIGLHCCMECRIKLCKEEYENCFVETYKGNNIFTKNGKYIPYWGCPYYFTSLEDCKAKIDIPNIGFY